MNNENEYRKPLCIAVSATIMPYPYKHTIVSSQMGHCASNSQIMTLTTVTVFKKCLEDVSSACLLLNHVTQTSCLPITSYNTLL